MEVDASHLMLLNEKILTDIVKYGFRGLSFNYPLNYKQWQKRYKLPLDSHSFH